MNYVEVGEGGGKPAHGPQRVMGNYFHQIYTGSHAEWWTTVFDPRSKGDAAVVFRSPETGGWRRRAVGGVKGRLGD